MTDFEVGDPVVATMGYGSHAELVSVPTRAAWRVPDGLSLEEAAGIPIEFGTADDCLFEFGHLKEGESVLVQAGAGGVGLAAIQLAKAAGATVLATASSDDRLEPAARLRDGPRHQLRAARTCRARCGAHRRPRRRPRRRSRRRQDVGGQHRSAGLSRPRQLGRPSRPRGTRTRGVAAHAEERARSPACSSARRW